MKYLFLIAITFLAGAGLIAQENSQTFTVKYISSDFVFLDNGSAAGLNTGDHLIISRGGQTIARIEVVSLAENSASCKIFEKTGDIQIGDTAEISSKKSMNDLEEEFVTLAGRNQAAASSTRRSKETPFARISGYISAQLYHFQDFTGNNLNFNQPAFRVNFKAKKIAGKELTFRVRTRTRYDQREQEIRPLVPQTEWRNRVYEISLAYEEPNAPLNVRLGRITTNHLSGVGYIDGMQLQANVSPVLKFGILAGTQPNWRTSEFQNHVRKYGAFANYAAGDFRSSRFETLLAGVAEYDSSHISREFIYLQNNFNYGARLFLYQSAEIDVNRQWRREKAGQTISLSNLFISGRYQINPIVNVGLTFDDRKNYWTYESRSLADSLFDDALRLGLRGNLSIRTPDGFLMYTNLGVRKQSAEPEPTYSFSGGVRKSNIFINRLFMAASISAFSNRVTNGANTAFRIGGDFPGGHRLEAGFGNYTYQVSAANDTRSNRFVRLDGNLSLLRYLFVSGQYEYDWGSDVRGQRIWAEIGIRL